LLAVPRWLCSRIVDMPALAAGEPNFADATRADVDQPLDVDWIL
jgi:hypothetical protein